MAKINDRRFRFGKVVEVNASTGKKPYATVKKSTMKSPKKRDANKPWADPSSRVLPKSQVEVTKSGWVYANDVPDAGHIGEVEKGKNFGETYKNAFKSKNKLKAKAQKERIKCQDCEGKGFISWDQAGSNNHYSEDCKTCDGTGESNYGRGIPWKPTKVARVEKKDK